MKKKNYWSSQRIFILTAVGAAVGLGNIWKFPYIAGENGGGAFVLVYLLCIILIGIPLLIAEITLGRAGKSNPVAAINNLIQNTGANKLWSIFAYNSIIASLLVLSFYTVIAGWVMAYFIDSITMSFVNISAEDSAKHFNNLVSSPIRVIIWHTIASIITIIIVAKGLKNGIEKAINFMMPGLGVILLILLIYAIFSSGGFTRSIDFLFNVNFDKLSWNAVIIALGHAFFTLSIGFGTMMVYGSYSLKEYSIVKTSLWIVFADTAIALLAGIVIFSIVFGSNLTPNSGVGLLFNTLPIAFGKMFGGSIMAILFFFMVILAAISSSISLLEPTISMMIEKFNLNRTKASIIIGAIVWLIGFGSVFSFNLWQDIHILADKTFFASLDFIVTNIMLPISGLFIAIFATWVWGTKKMNYEINIANNYATIFNLILKFITPALIIIVFIFNLI